MPKCESQLLKWVPKLQILIVKSGHNFLNSWNIAQISLVLVSGMEGANFRPYTLEKHEIYPIENEERKTGVLGKTYLQQERSTWM